MPCSAHTTDIKPYFKNHYYLAKDFVFTLPFKMLMITRSHSILCSTTHYSYFNQEKLMPTLRSMYRNCLCKNWSLLLTFASPTSPESEPLLQFQNNLPDIRIQTTKIYLHRST